MIGEIPISDACHYMDAHDTETPMWESVKIILTKSRWHKKSILPRWTFYAIFQKLDFWHQH